MIGTIELKNKGLCALVDVEGMDKLSAHTWRADIRPHTIYAVTTIPKTETHRATTAYMHRMVIGDCEEVDHRDGIGLNNRKYNLRKADRLGNTHNTIGNTKRTGLPKGVTKLKRLHSNPWQARIAHNGHQIHIGYFSSAEDAARAYNKKALELFGEFAKLNEVQ